LQSLRCKLISSTDESALEKLKWPSVIKSDERMA
jgi:hypothetical protein